jgi:hypothetical protein
MRTYRLRGKRGKRLGFVKGFRTRRSNPGTANFVPVLAALAAGALAAIASGYAIDMFMSTSTPTTQTGVLVVAAGAAAFLIGSPALAAGTAVGLLLVPLTKAVYAAVPTLANPTPYGTTPAPALPPATDPNAPAPSIVGLHMAGLHGSGIRGLHMAGLERGAMGFMGRGDPRASTMSR